MDLAASAFAIGLPLNAVETRTSQHFLAYMRNGEVGGGGWDHHEPHLSTYFLQQRLLQHILENGTRYDVRACHHVSIYEGPSRKRQVKKRGFADMHGYAGLIL
jgi:hypothetical protein